MPNQGAQAGAQAGAPAAAEALVDSQAANTCTVGDMIESSSNPSKRFKLNAEREASEQSAAVASLSMLLIGQLVDIFLYLNTSEVARAAQVSKIWHEASTDESLWRHLCFSPAKYIRPPYYTDHQEQVREHFASIGARSGHTVESVDFSNLYYMQVFRVVKALSQSTSSLRHIRWSSTEDTIESRQAVAALAEVCPGLETLELRTWDE